MGVLVSWFPGFMVSSLLVSSLPVSQVSPVSGPGFCRFCSPVSVFPVSVLYQHPLRTSSKGGEFRWV